jgi:hypothetical protein
VEAETMMEDLQHMSRRHRLARLLGHGLVDVRIKRRTGGTVDPRDTVAAENVQNLGGCRTDADCQRAVVPCGFRRLDGSFQVVKGTEQVPHQRFNRVFFLFFYIPE